MPEEPATSSDAAAPAADAAPAKKRSKLPLIVSAVLLLAGGAAGAWYAGLLPFGHGSGTHAEATAAIPDDEGEHGGGPGEEGEGHGAAKEPGAMLSLEPFIANLADEGGSRYLKATFQVEFLGSGVPPAAEARLPQIRDLLLTLLTSKTFSEIRTPDGKQQLREEIITRINQVLDRDAVKAVYFTEFIVQ